jgi:hypothetical protein
MSIKYIANIIHDVNDNDHNEKNDTTLLMMCILMSKISSSYFKIINKNVHSDLVQL